MKKRSKLVLPAPQIGSGELEQIIKMGQAGERANAMAESGSEADVESTRATSTLLSEYNVVSDQALNTLRTPKQQATAQETILKVLLLSLVLNNMYLTTSQVFITTF